MKALIPALLTALAASSAVAQVPLSLDTSFRCTRFFSGSLIDNLPLDDGSVVVTAYYAYLDNCCSSPFGPHGWLRILPNGDIDESWPIGVGRGLIYPFGPYYYISVFLHRYFQTTGERDATFPVNSNHNPDRLYGNMGNMSILSDGKILHVGDMWLQEQWGLNLPSPNFSLWRINADGLLDSTYHYRKTDGVIWTIEPTTQERFLLSGVYNTYEGLPEGRILRIWPDGSLDTTFHTDIIKGYAHCYVEQANGRIIAGGQFVFPNDPDTLHLIRLMPNGALDPTFNNHAEYKGRPSSFGDFGFGVQDALALEDGSIIVGGSFDKIDGQLRRSIAVLDSTGHLIEGLLNGEGCGLTHDYNSTSMFSGLGAIHQAPDGSIFITGVFKGFDDGTTSDTSMTFIAKLHGLSVGINEARKTEHQLWTYPNPGTDRLYIKNQDMLPTTSQVELIGVDGRILAGSFLSRIRNGWFLPGIDAGTYFIQITTPEGDRIALPWIHE